MSARFCCQSQCNITSPVLWKLHIPHCIFSFIDVNIMLCSVTWFWNCCLDPLSNTADMVEQPLIWMSTNSTYFSLPCSWARITSVNMTPWTCDHLWHTSPLLQCIYQPDIALSCFINKPPLWLNSLWEGYFTYPCHDCEASLSGIQEVKWKWHLLSRRHPHRKGDSGNQEGNQSAVFVGQSQRESWGDMAWTWRTSR